jgi:pseudouridine kinase
MICNFCRAGTTEQFQAGRTYWICPVCGGISCEPADFLPPEKQRERYLYHHNSTGDAGYYSFLKSFADPVLEFYATEEGRNPDRILDYGSGPFPALIQVFEHHFPDGQVQIRGWDPFFSPEIPRFEKEADSGCMDTSTVDLVTCLEVAEHFENPDEGFAGIASWCRSGGYAAIGTMLLPDDYVTRLPDTSKLMNFFIAWWYRTDSTHVSFYSLPAVIACAQRNGFVFVKQITERLCLFRKV